MLIKYVLFISTFLYLTACTEQLPLAELNSAKQELSIADTFQASKYAPSEYSEARNSLIEAHNSISKSKSNSEGKKAAMYSYGKARESIERSIPYLINDSKESAFSEVEKVNKTSADKFFPKEYKELIALKSEAEKKEEESAKLLRSYPNIEVTEEKSEDLRSQAFDSYYDTYLLYNQLQLVAKDLLAKSLEQYLPILNSYKVIEYNCNSMKKIADLSEQERLRSFYMEYEVAFDKVSEGDFISAIPVLDKLKKESDDWMKNRVIPFIEKNNILAKTKIDSAAKQFSSVPEDIIEKNDTLKELKRDYQLELAIAKKKLESAGQKYEQKDYSNSIDQSNDSIIHSEKAISILSEFLKIASTINIESPSKKKLEENIPKPENKEHTNIQNEIPPSIVESHSDALEEDSDESKENTSTISQNLSKQNRASQKQTKWKTYKVKKNNTLTKIASENGDPNEWKKIYKANKDKIKDPNKIYPNQVIKIPVENKSEEKESDLSDDINFKYPDPSRAHERERRPKKKLPTNP